jgi:hypothetical protein
MPGEVIAMANPKPLPSHLPSESLSLAVELKVSKLDKSSAEGLRAFRDAANYIAAGTTGILFGSKADVPATSNDIPSRQHTDAAKPGL